MAWLQLCKGMLEKKITNFKDNMFESTVSEDAGIEPWTVANLALTALTTRLDFCIVVHNVQGLLQPEKIISRQLVTPKS